MQHRRHRPNTPAPARLVPAFIAGAAFVLIAFPHATWSIDVRGQASVETRGFPQEGLYDGQGGGAISVAGELELIRDFAGNAQRVAFVPFARLDSRDEQRTHFDVRELYWELSANAWELRVGANRVFWGVTEAQHLVDIINQTDQVENPDGEDKLGQPMVNLSIIRDWGTTDLFLLTGFRERTYPGESGRLRGPFVVDTDNSTFESSAEHWHVDWALRYAHYFGPMDIGVSYFNGTSREPQLFPARDTNDEVVLRPHYPLISQFGVDTQFIAAGWAWKLEAISRDGFGDRFAAVTGGFEYTFVGVGSTPLDLGVLAEYLWDERGKFATTPFDNDVFVGTRLALNDVQSTDVLSGAVVDTENGAVAVLVEGSRRLRESWTLTLEARGFGAAPKGDLFHAFRNDSYLQIDLARYF